MTKLVTTCPRCGEEVLILRQVASIAAYAAVDIAPSDAGLVTIDENNGTFAGVGRMRPEERRKLMRYQMHYLTCKGASRNARREAHNAKTAEANG